METTLTTATVTTTAATSSTTLPEFVTNYKVAYDKMLALFLEKGITAITYDKENETPAFRDYAEATKTVISIKMYSVPSNSWIVSELYKYGDYCHFTIKNAYKKRTKQNDSKYDENDLEEELKEEQDVKKDTPCDNDDTNQEVLNRDDMETDIYSVDDVRDILFAKVIFKDFHKQYYLNKSDAKHAYNSICTTIHNELIDMYKKLLRDHPEAKPTESSKYEITDSETLKLIDKITAELEEEMVESDRPTSENSEKNKKRSTKKSRKPEPIKKVSLNGTVGDDDGNDTSLSELVPDPSKNTEKEALLANTLTTAKSIFIDKVVSAMLEDNKSHYAIAYLNHIADRDSIDLYYDIFEKGFDYALGVIIDELSYNDIDVSYLKTKKINWSYNNKEVKKNYPNNWLDHGSDFANKLYKKSNLSA